ASRGDRLDSSSRQEADHGRGDLRLARLEEVMRCARAKWRFAHPAGLRPVAAQRGAASANLRTLRAAPSPSRTPICWTTAEDAARPHELSRCGFLSSSRRGAAYAYNVKALRDKEMLVALQAERNYERSVAQWKPRRPKQPARGRPLGSTQIRPSG